MPGRPIPARPCPRRARRSVPEQARAARRDARRGPPRRHLCRVSLAGADQLGERRGPERRQRRGYRRPSLRDHRAQGSQPRPLRRVLRHAGGDHVPQPSRHPGQVGLPGDHPVQHRSRAAAAERGAARRRVGQHAAEGEHVARRPGLRPLGLFRRHVAWRAHHHPGGGHRRPLERAGDAEVDHVRPVPGEQDVGRLEVAVHHAAGVHRTQRLGQPGGEPPDGRFGERPVPLDHVGERGPGHVGRREPRRVVVQPRGDHGGGVHAADRARGGHLPAEPLPELRVAREFRVHDLDGHRPPGRGEAQVHPAHAASAQPGAQLKFPHRTRVVSGKRFHPCSQDAQRHRTQRLPAFCAQPCGKKPQGW